MGQCKLIHTLKMKETKVTKIGIKVALENLPNLKTFEFCRSVQILAEIRRENLERGCFKTYSITQFQCTEFEDHNGNMLPYEIGSLRLEASLCPSVNVVHITLQPGLTDFELCGLLELKALRELEIEDYYYVDEFEWDNNEITFHGGVLPLLKAFGSSLVRLTLYQLNIWVNIRAIAKLEYLTLDDIARCSVVSLEEESHHEEVMLKHLKKLRLAVSQENSYGLFPSKVISFVFVSLCLGPLVSLEFLGCDGLTNKFLEEVTRLDRFPNLELLNISRCDNVTKKGIDCILNVKIPLRYLYVIGCNRIRKKEFDEWRKKAREENWEIKFGFEEPKTAENDSDADFD